MGEPACLLLCMNLSHPCALSLILPVLCFRYWNCIICLFFLTVGDCLIYSKLSWRPIKLGGITPKYWLQLVNAKIVKKISAHLFGILYITCSRCCFNFALWMSFSGWCTAHCIVFLKLELKNTRFFNFVLYHLQLFFFICIYSAEILEGLKQHFSFFPLFLCCIVCDIFDLSWC